MTEKSSKLNKNFVNFVNNIKNKKTEYNINDDEDEGIEYKHKLKLKQQKNQKKVVNKLEEDVILNIFIYINFLLESCRIKRK
jgi:hypothetical protein